MKLRPWLKSKQPRRVGGKKSDLGGRRSDTRKGKRKCVEDLEKWRVWLELKGICGSGMDDWEECVYEGDASDVVDDR